MHGHLNEKIPIIYFRKIIYRSVPHIKINNANKEFSETTMELRILFIRWLFCDSVRDVPLGLTFNNSTFCPHSVFACFVWISEQTVIISLYSINWLVFVTETDSVYCAVRPESFIGNSIWIQSSKRFSAACFWCRRKRITLMYFSPHRWRPRSIRFCFTEYNFSSTF